MAIKRTLRVNVRCPRHRQENGLNPRVACRPCMSLAAIRQKLSQLEAAIETGLRAGLTVPNNKGAATHEHANEQQPVAPLFGNLVE